MFYFYLISFFYNEYYKSPKESIVCHFNNVAESRTFYFKLLNGIYTHLHYL